jgi:hypothetical protein
MAELLSTNVNGSITIVSSSAALIVPPPANNITVFGENYANRVMLSVKGPSGLDSPLQYHFGHNKVAYWTPIGNATTVPLAFGTAAPTANGTATTRTVATTNIFTRTRRLGYVSATTANSAAGYRNTALQYTTGTANTGEGGFFYIHRFGITNGIPANPTMFIGLNNNTGAPANGVPNTTNSIGIGAAPGSNNLQLCYGGSTAQPRIDLGDTLRANVANDAIYQLTLFSPQSTANASNTVVHYHVTKTNNAGVFSNTGTIQGGSTILPSNTTLLGIQNWRSGGTSGTAVGLDLISLYIEADY